MSKLILLLTWVGSVFFAGNTTSNTSDIHNPLVSSIAAQSGESYDCCTGQEENPIIWATVYDAQNNLAQGAAVDVYDNSTSTLLGGTTTAADGTFAVRVEDGDYYFKITPVGSSTSTTSVYTVSGSDLTVTVNL